MDIPNLKINAINYIHRDPAGEAYYIYQAWPEPVLVK